MPSGVNWCLARSSRCRRLPAFRNGIDRNAPTANDHHSIPGAQYGLNRSAPAPVTPSMDSATEIAVERLSRSQLYFVPAPAQVGVVCLQGLGALAGACVDQQLFWVGGSGELPDSVAVQPQVTGDRFKSVALGDQGVNGGIPLAGADGDPVLPGLRRPRWVRAGRWSKSAGLRVRRGDQGVQVVTVLGDGTLEGFAEVVHTCQRSATWIASGAG